MAKQIERLQYISQGRTATEQLQGIQFVLDAGLKWIQLRCKDFTNDAYLDLGLEVQQRCKVYGATLIINDRVDLSRQLHADGLHVGLEDTAVSIARDMLQPDTIIGGTANTLADLQQRVQENCDYIGLGPFTYTSTKKKLSPVLGLSGYQALLKTQITANVPVIAIGGVQINDANILLDSGLYGLAMSGGLLNSTATEMKQLLRYLNTL